MTATTIQRGVYNLDGTALLIVGQPATLTLQLTQPNPSGSGPDVPQAMAGRGFVQQLIGGDGSVLATAAGSVLQSGKIRFQYDADQVAALLPVGAGAIDLVYRIQEVVVGGLDLVFQSAFSIRTPVAGNPTALFVLNTDVTASTPLLVRYAGAPGAPGVSSLLTCRRVTAIGPVQVEAGEQFIAMANGEATTVTLPQDPAAGLAVTVKDVLGLAPGAPVTVQAYVGQIDGQANWVCGVAWFAITFLFDGLTWSIL